MIRIRMQRFGRTHRPFYRINAIDQRTRRNGRVLENLGFYNPMEKDADKQIELKVDAIKAWIAKGAQPSDTVMDMLGNRDLLEGDMKAQWEKQREMNNKRGECKKAVKSIEAIVAELDKMAEDSEADLTPFANTAKRELNNAKNAVAKAKNDDANKALATAEDAKKQAAAAQPAPEPEPEPEPEADAEGSEDDAAE